MLTSYAHWPIRQKLLIPVVTVFTASALIWAIVFTDVTDTMEEKVLPFQVELAKARALSYSLANEYREYFGNPDRDVLAEIDANKVAIEPVLAWLASNSGDGSHKSYRAIDVDRADTALKRIVQLGTQRQACSVYETV